MRNVYRTQGFKKALGIVCAMVLLISAVYVPVMLTTAAAAPSVEFKDNEAVTFDFSEVMTDSKKNEEAAKGEAGVGYFGWGWEVKNGVLKAAKDNNQSWSTGGGYRLHKKLADGTYAFCSLEVSTRYVVSFKIRVMGSPRTIEGSKDTNKAYINLVYNLNYNPESSGQKDSYVNVQGTTAKKVYESLIDSNAFTLYDDNGNGTVYPCGEDWYTVTYFVNTPASFSKDDVLGFYTSNYTGTHVEIDDVSVIKIGADSGIILLTDTYSATDELLFGKDGEILDLTTKDISDRAKETSHTFEGWYSDAARTQKVTEVAFSKDEDKTVYSRWNAPVTVTFKNTLDGSETKITGMAGDSFTYPEDPTDPEGKVWFMGWFKDEAGATEHKVPQYGYADETIYTFWKGNVPGLTQDFENYTKDSYTVATDANGQKYKSNRLIFAATMTKQSEVTYDNSGYAVKYHWNPVQITDKNDHNYYDTSRVTAKDNYFLLGSGLENNNLYVVTFKYLAEKTPAPVSFYMVTGNSNNAWDGVVQYETLNNVTLENDGKWHEVTMQFTPNYKDGKNGVYLGISNTQNVETVVYFDDIKIESFAQPYESVISVNTNIDGNVVTFKGKRGDKIVWPEMIHPENAPFNGYYLDKTFTQKYESEVFERLPVTVYAQWLSYSGFTQDFENYTADNWTPQVSNKTYDNGTPDDTSDDKSYTATYKSNYLIFYTTMSKQSEVVNSGNNAIKFHWNTDPSTDKILAPDGKNVNEPESYEHKRYSSDDNLFYLGKGLEENQYYDVTFKYKVEKGSQDVQFYFLTADANNSWGGRKTYMAPEKVSLKKTDGWVEYTFSFITGAISSHNAGFLGIDLTQHSDVIMYIDDVKVKSLTNSAEVLMFLETGTGEGQVKHIGRRGEAINLPTIIHPDDAEFLGWYLDSACTVPFTETVYPLANTILYAKWAPYAMTFREYPYEGDPQNDPNVSVLHQKGAGKNDDHAVRFYVNRKADNTTGLGSTQAIRIAGGIEDGGVYRIRYDYKSSSIQSSAAVVRVVSADNQNIWWSDITYKYNHTTVTLPEGGTGGWKTAEFVIRANVKSDSWRKAEELYLRLEANIYKAGDKIDVVFDNVWVEKVEAPYVFFEAQNGGTPGFDNGNVGDKIKTPEVPARVGYTFGGWYLEPECENKFTLETYEADTALTVYAKWNPSSTYIYSFENYSYKDDTEWTYVGGTREASARKTGDVGLRFGKRDPDEYSLSCFMLEDGGEYFKVEKGRCYILTLNYKINKVGDNNLQIGWLASAYGNLYVGKNSGKTILAPTMQVTTDQGKEMKGKWVKQVFVLDAMKLEKVSDTHLCEQVYCYLTGEVGWDILIDDVAITPVPKGQVAVGFYNEGAKGCPDYLIGKPGQDYSKKVPETLEMEGMYFKGYSVKSADGTFQEKTRGNMVFGETAEMIYARFLKYEVTENFDEGFYEKAYGKGLGYTIHDFDYEVYDSQKEGNSKDNVTSGQYSLHRKGESMFNENSVILTLGNNIAEGERYTVTMKVKLGKHFHTDGAVKLVSSRSFEYAWTTTGDYYPVVPIADLKEGEWTEVSYTFNSVESFVTLQTPGYVELFIDDITFKLVDESVPLSEPKEYTEYVAAERDANGNLLYKDRTAVDVSTIIDASLSAKQFPMIIVYVGAGVLGLAAVIVVLILFVFRKKKA